MVTLEEVYRDRYPQERTPPSKARTWETAPGEVPQGGNGPKILARVTFLLSRCIDGSMGKYE